MSYDQRQRGNDIISIISNYSHIPERMIKSKCRKREFVILRHLSIYFISKTTNLSLNSISRFVGMKNHSSVIHAKKKISNFISVNDEKIMKPYLDLSEIFDVN